MPAEILEGIAHHIKPIFFHNVPVECGFSGVIQYDPTVVPAAPVICHNRVIGIVQKDAVIGIGITRIVVDGVIIRVPEVDSVGTGTARIVFDDIISGVLKMDAEPYPGARVIPNSIKIGFTQENSVVIVFALVPCNGIKTRTV